MALLDSGCGQRLIRNHLGPPADARLGEIRLQCTHGDVRPYPSAWAQLTIDGVTRRMVVGLAPSLAYPVILGRDWPGFPAVLRRHAGGGLASPRSWLDGRARTRWCERWAPSPMKFVSPTDGRSSNGITSTSLSPGGKEKDC
uniref:Peptidase A2 domain-containing protein n=1 Tax=Gopherus agassizii TaxID=38772 RepID=A0A452IPR2_9SAUR